MAGKTYSVKAIIQGIDRMTGPMGRIARGIKGTLGGALKGIGKLAGWAGGALRSMLTPLGLIASGGVVASLGALVKGFVTSGDEIGKFARQVGLGVEALQEFRFAADRQGVPVDAFEKSLVFLQRNLGLARLKTGDLYTVLRKLPRGFRDAMLGAGSTEEALSLALGAVGSVADESDRAALATKLFGESGARMARLSEAGAEGIAKLREEARALGLVMSKEQTDAAEEMNDRLTDMKGALLGLRLAIGGALLPVLRPLVVKLTDWFKANRDLIGQKIGAFVRGIVEWIGRIDFAAIGRGLSNFWEGVKKVFDLIGGVKGLLVGIGLMTFAPLVASLGPVGVALAGVLGLVAAIGTGLDALNDRGKQSRKWASTNARAAVLTGNPQEARNALEAQARSERDARLERGLRTPFGTGRIGGVLAGSFLGALVSPFALSAPTTAGDYVGAARQTPRDMARALRDILVAGPPSARTASALTLDINVRRDGSLDVTAADATGPVTATVHGPAPGVRASTARGR